MKTKKLKLIIVLLAAIIVSVFNLLQKYSLKRFSYTLLVVVLIFFIIGAIVQKIVDNIVKKEVPFNEPEKQQKAVEKKSKSVENGPKIEVPKEMVNGEDEDD